MNYHCEIQNRNNNSADNQVCLPPIQVLFNSIERRNVPKLAFANTDRSCDNMRCNTAEEQTYAAPVLLPQHPVVYPAVNSGLEATTIATTQFLPDSTTNPETQPVLENIKPCYKSAPIYEIINNETDMHAQTKRSIPEFEDSKSKKKQNSGRRSNLPKETVQVLNTWLLNHLNNPYPTQQEKRELLIKTGLTKIQLSNWFINVRRRKIFSDYYTLVNSIPSDNTNNTPMEQAQNASVYHNTLSAANNTTYDATSNCSTDYELSKRFAHAPVTRRKKLIDRLEELKKLSNPDMN
ncbi:hypothetical protein N7582_005535 [Saccharomyces uvarum]|uniref:Homeobox domain-containing protein n=1 Tax=Saccharomyces uvarum TaxID=230603 RepID=A0AA35J8G7_SACUV|nr:hypothetical protein N7582_005535 [Saccharomyces uvarum]CAI4052682.1 hypothetical protein SUVC_16G1040 [Saccharomyces uvarum]